MLGQIATFIESLHLTYKEIVEEIPYRNLIIMSRDKMHVAMGDIEMTAEEERAFIREKMKSQK